MLSQRQQQNQRLLDIPRSSRYPRGEMRRCIAALLREHPEGLSPALFLLLARDTGVLAPACERIQ